MRNQPAPPHVIFEALTEPNRDLARPWLLLLDDEQRPPGPPSVGRRACSGRRPAGTLSL